MPRPRASSPPSSSAASCVTIRRRRWSTAWPGYSRRRTAISGPCWWRSSRHRSSYRRTLTRQRRRRRSKSWGARSARSMGGAVPPHDPRPPREVVVSAVRALDGGLDPPPAPGAPARVVGGGLSLARQVARLGELLYEAQPPTGHPDVGRGVGQAGALLGR